MRLNTLFSNYHVDRTMLCDNLHQFIRILSPVEAVYSRRHNFGLLSANQKFYFLQLGVVYIHEMFLEYASNIFLTQVVLLVVSVIILIVRGSPPINTDCLVPDCPSAHKSSTGNQIPGQVPSFQKIPNN